MIEFRDALTDLLEEFGTDDGGFKGDLPEGRYMRVDSKNFYFDIGQNNRGIYMRISEVRAMGYEGEKESDVKIVISPRKDYSKLTKKSNNNIIWYKRPFSVYPFSVYIKYLRGWVKLINKIYFFPKHVVLDKAQNEYNLFKITL